MVTHLAKCFNTDDGMVPLVGLITIGIASALASLRPCTTDEDCFGSYCMNGANKSAPYYCHTNNVPSKLIGKDINYGLVELPMQGLGTWQYNDTVAGAAVAKALKMGYVHIDTAFDYQNQKGIGDAMRASTRKRSSTI